MLISRVPDYQNIVANWAAELSSHLGRLEEEIVRNGLSAYDFPSGEGVEIRFADRSSVRFRYAFFVVSTSRELVAVFTEHCGYHVYPLGGTEITRITVGETVFG